MKYTKKRDKQIARENLDYVPADRNGGGYHFDRYLGQPVAGVSSRIRHLVRSHRIENREARRMHDVVRDVKP